MPIKHPTIKAPGERLFALADWNVDHTGTAAPEAHGNAAHTSNFITGAEVPANETDPDWAAWLAGPPNVSIFTNDSGYLTAWGPEADPVFTAWDKDHADLSNVTANQHHTKYTNAEAVAAVAAADKYLKNDADDTTTGTLTAQGGLNVGVDDTTAGLINVYGDNNVAGGKVRLHNAANEDGAKEYWDIETHGAYMTFYSTGAAAALTIGTDTVTAALNLVEGTRAQFFTYKTTAQDLASANTWYDVTWADQAAPIKQGFTHNHAASSEQITVTNSGTYLISYTVAVFYANWDRYNFRVLDDGTEIAGSYNLLLSYYEGVASHTFIAKIVGGSVIELQAGTQIAGSDIMTFDTANMPDPTTRPSATISITKLSNDV